MIELESSCFVNHNLLHDMSLEIKLPSSEEILISMQLGKNINELQETMVAYISRNEDRIFDEKTLIDVGTQHLENCQYETAAKVFQTNTLLYPESSKSWEGLALAHKLMQKPSHALAYYSEALELQPDNTKIICMINHLSQKLMSY